MYTLYRPQYFKLLDQCTAQIVLHKSGIDPDFHYTRKFQVDVDNLIGTYAVRMMSVPLCMLINVFSFTEGMVDKAKVEEAEGKIYELEQQVSCSGGVSHYHFTCWHLFLC